MGEKEIAQQRPHDIDEALEAMRTTLEYYHAHHDNRAIFLRLYYIMTIEVHAAINGYGDYAGKQIFIDPGWVRRLSGRFSTKYFESLDPDTRSRAWSYADGVAKQPHSAVVENAVLGINAHISFDLPRAIGENLDPAELDDYRKLQLRKFDHDQVNNLLIRVLNQIQTTLAEDYEPGIAIADALMGNLDELASGEALKIYRERVWWNALTFAAAKVDGQDGLVRDKLDWESAHLAKDLIKAKWLWSEERALDLVASPFRRTKNWADITLERPQRPEQAGGPPDTAESPVSTRS
ncbi:MAG: hypothetical protein H0X35_02315 [Pseudonocardiales bacterium]|nr:hypothetical protein [Pseudonocardiales bacterium]